MDLAEWLEAAAASTRDVSASALGMANASWTGPSVERLPGDLRGIYIPLLTDDFALQLGVLASAEVCSTLARRLIGGGEECEPLESDADVFDAVGEVTNLIAGTVKVLLADRFPIRVGVPLALSGRVIPIGAARSTHGPIQLDDSRVWLVITGTRKR